MKTITLPDGTPVPALGLGTWRMGEHEGSRAQEVAAVRRAFELGYRLIDTAEMYGEGGAETVVGQALRLAVGEGIVGREDVCLVSKVYPHNASTAGVVTACERSLRRLGVDYLDVYLLHWRGQHPLAATVAGFEQLVAAGRIRSWGVSNFDVDDMTELWNVDGGQACVINQVYYSVSERGVEFELLPWQRRHGVPLMAYSPIDQGMAARDGTLAGVGAARGLTAAQVALAWAVRHRDAAAVPKTVREQRLSENLEAAAVELTDDELAAIDRAFPPPAGRSPLAML